MSMLKYIKPIVPEFIIRLLKRCLKRNRLVELLSPHLSESICIDVGASYYPHSKWLLFLESQNTSWIAVEPNEKNIGYIKSWTWPSRVKAITTGLSREGGIKTLYVTNVDSGSSLLEPVISAGMKHRVNKEGLDYFFPVKTLEINTMTLADVIENESIKSPVFVKLDTQGTELSILQGAIVQFQENRIVGIEMESTLLAQPFMKGSGRFWEACEYLEKNGFELIDINPIRATSTLKISSPLGKGYLNECDAVFALRRDIVKTLPLNYRIGLFAFYLSYKLFEEAISILEEDQDIQAYFSSKQLEIKKLSQLIYSLA